KVPCAILSLEVKEEQHILPQQRENGLPPPKQLPNDIVDSVPDAPPTVPLGAVTQHGPDTEGPIITAKFCALAE
ncbi:hypothetical protein ACLOJK_035097, partial [Asimina triloba]